jgi:hypothetical protein
MDPQGRYTVRVEERCVTSRTYFSQVVAEGAIVYGLCKEGVLTGVSVGFNPLEDPRPLPGGGQHFSRIELLEYSHVALPCNPYCLTTATKTHTDRVRRVLSRGRVADTELTRSPRIHAQLRKMAGPRPAVLAW